MLGKYINFVQTLGRLPHATARVRGSKDYSSIWAVTKFFQTERGVLVATEATGLPYLPGKCEHFVFGFHIHEGSSCTGNKEDVFAGARTHYNPEKCPHPRHAGDLPPLFGNKGEAFSVFLTNRFTVEEIIGKTLVIHASPDDFYTQPAGNSGEKIACGVIR